LEKRDERETKIERENGNERDERKKDKKEA